jgi:hypothetical protein
MPPLGFAKIKFKFAQTRPPVNRTDSFDVVPIAEADGPHSTVRPAFPAEFVS